MSDPEREDPAQTEDVLFERRDALGLITLNRPKALNALNRGMCVAIHAQLDDWATDDAIKTVAIVGAGEKAFCAGGDVVGLYHAGQAGAADWEEFFADEYRMNLRIGTYAKPYVALIDGITMGGGVGLSIHAPFRVATERTLFAMPETGIGLIPDVGGTHALARLPGEIGTWLGLTGARLKAPECLAAGIATHHMGSDCIEDLLAELAAETDPVPDILMRYHATAEQPCTLTPNREAIDRHFAADTCEEIMASLSSPNQEGGDDWAEAQRDILMKMSPTSMKLTRRALREAKGDTLANCLAREYRLVGNIKSGHDFYEGVRAQLIDKDRKPRWQPSALSVVPDEMVDGYFEAPPHGDWVT